MKNQRNKASERPKKTSSRNKAAPMSSRSERNKAPQPPAGRVHRTSEGTIEENSEEAAP